WSSDVCSSDLDRRGGGSRADGRSDARCGYRRAQVLPCGPHAETALRIGFEPCERRCALDDFPDFPMTSPEDLRRANLLSHYSSRKKGREMRVVKIDHEGILCNYRIQSRSRIGS